MADNIYRGEVLARYTGFYLDTLRPAGARFYFEGVLGTWMETAEQEAERLAAEKQAAALAAREADALKKKSNDLNERLAEVERREAALNAKPSVQSK